mmetsp:Transcript_6723/g.12003  ORF Transcript_6723/g.12003 Transcript_6723/m.12003 type:complete len:230 (-) Transcript_6723:144-833(-)
MLLSTLLALLFLEGGRWRRRRRAQQLAATGPSGSVPLRLLTPPPLPHRVAAIDVSRAPPPSHLLCALLLDLALQLVTPSLVRRPLVPAPLLLLLLLAPLRLRREHVRRLLPLGPQPTLQQRDLAPGRPLLLLRTPRHRRHRRRPLGVPPGGGFGDAALEALLLDLLDLGRAESHHALRLHHGMHVRPSRRAGALRATATPLPHDAWQRRLNAIGGNARTRRNQYRFRSR